MCRWFSRSTVFTTCNKTQMIQKYSHHHQSHCVLLGVTFLLAAQMILTLHSMVLSDQSVLSTEPLKMLTYSSHGACFYFLFFLGLITQKACTCLCVFSALLWHKNVPLRKWHQLNSFHGEEIFQAFIKLFKL